MQKRSIFRIIIVIAFFDIFTAKTLCSQNKIRINNDLQLIQTNEKSRIAAIDSTKNKQRQFLIQKSDPLIDKINPVKLTFGGLLYFYQTSLSKHFSADCLYEPSCSNFSRDVIAHYGIIKGIFLTADRLSRCNRIAQTSIHPLSINLATGHSRDSYSKYQFKTLSKPSHFH